MDGKKQFDEILREGIAALQDWAARARDQAENAARTTESIVSAARAKMEDMKAFLSDVTSGRILTADKLLVDEIDFDSFPLPHGGLDRADPVPEIQLRIPRIDFAQAVYRGGDPGFRLQGRYRLLMVFQRTGTPKEEAK